MTSRKRKESTLNPSPAKRLRESNVRDSEFRVVNAAATLAVPPVFSANPRAGVEEMLDSMVMRYNPSLQGVVLSHSNVTFAGNIARIQYDCPFLICNVKFDAAVWSPRIGCKLSGKVNLCSPDHVSLLVHRTFNVSIPRHHIPMETWEFEYGPAENDPEFGFKAEELDGGVIDHSAGGRWIHRVTGEILGGGKGLLEFTVIGLTVANEMLSLLGSLQLDPFSPRHVVTAHTKPDPTQNDFESNSNSSESGDSAAHHTGKRGAVEGEFAVATKKRRR